MEKHGIDPDGKSELRKYVLYRDGSTYFRKFRSFHSIRKKKKLADSNPTSQICSRISVEREPTPNIFDQSRDSPESRMEFRADKVASVRCILMIHRGGRSHTSPKLFCCYVVTRDTGSSLRIICSFACYQALTPLTKRQSTWIGISSYQSYFESRQPN
jgi:hypothetical protein